MNNLSWKKFPFKDSLHIECLELTNNNQINTFNYTTWAFYIGKYKDNEFFQVSIKSPLFFILDTNKDFSTIIECKEYVEETFKNWLKEFL